jgi:hypothetical protein
VNSLTPSAPVSYSSLNRHHADFGNAGALVAAVTANPRIAAQGRFRTFQIYPKDLAPPQVNNLLTQKS